MYEYMTSIRLYLIIDIQVHVHCTIIYMYYVIRTIIMAMTDLFLILVLTRGASNLGLVPTSKTRSASCNYQH